MSRLHPFTFRLDTQTEQAISNAAKAAHITKSEFCRKIFMNGYKQLVEDFKASQPQAVSTERPPQEDIATAEHVRELSDKIAEIKEQQERIACDFYNQRNMLTDIYIMLEALATNRPPIVTLSRPRNPGSARSHSSATASRPYPVSIRTARKVNS